MITVQLSAINVIAELERIGWDFEPAGDNEIKCKCPAHGDDTPSCAINVDKRLWKCHAAGCGKDGDVITFIALALKTTRRVVFEDLTKRYEGLDADKTIDADAVERHHQAIWSAPQMIKELRDRGLDDSDIRKYRLGFDKGRITIPITNAGGMYVNIRRYLPGAPGPEKMKNTRGHGDIRLYPHDQLRYDKIIIAGGEMKAIVTARHMNPFGWGAVTATAGEGNWHVDFNERFRGKRVVIVMDIDNGGLVAANQVAASLHAWADYVGTLVLPLDNDKYPKGDLNDYFGPAGYTGEHLLALVEGTDKWSPPIPMLEVDDDAAPVHLSDATKANYAGKLVRTRGIISAMDETPYLVPKTVVCKCDKSADLCSICPVYFAAGENVEMTIKPDSSAILSMIDAPRKAQRDAIREALKIPPCKKVHFETSEHFSVQDLRLTPQLAISSRASDRIVQPCFVIAHGLETNSSYEFVGRIHPHPQTQQAVLLSSEAKPTEDALALYKPDPAEMQGLRLFQPKEWTKESLEEQLKIIYNDLSANVTRIFMRDDLHLAIDLAYHSALLIPFDGRTVRGWVEVLIAGDSSQGKSETAERLQEHYGLGERVDCKNATVAGLLGGLTQIGNRWFVQWGVIPMHDKRLVILEELKGASTELISKLTDMRSSGVALIPKIEKRRTHARCRLIAISNPRPEGVPLSSYNFGVEAIKDLIGGLEDVRRFDYCLLVSSSQVPKEEYAQLQRQRPVVPHVFTSDLSRKCVLWAWTRLPEHVKFEPEAAVAILDAAAEMCSMFSEIIPIVDRGSMRFKLARLATSLACRTFSTEDCESVIIRKCHVEVIKAFLIRTYSDRVFGYKDFSDAVNSSSQLLDEKLLEKRILSTPFPRDFIEQMINTNEIEIVDIRDWCGWEQGEAMALMSLLVRKHALMREKRSYRKSPVFIDMLKRLRSSKELEIASRPDFIEEKEEF